MIANDTYMLDGIRDDIALDLRCRVADLNAALPNLVSSGLGDVTLHENGRVTLISRRLKREHLARKNGAIRAARYRCNTQSNADSTSAYASVSGSDSSGKRGSGERGPDRPPLPPATVAQTALDLSAAANLADAAIHGKIPWERVESWLAIAAKNGADYTSAEARAAWLSFEANGWMWGRNPIADYRAAIERQIQSDRERKGTRPPATSLPGQAAAVSGADKMILQKELERALDRVRVIKAGYERDQSYRQADREELARLARIVRENREKLGLRI